MKILFIVFGIILIILSIATIAKEKENYNFAENHPIERIVLGAPNPDLKGYSYTPPFTLHELFMITALGGGIALLVVGIIFKKNGKAKNNI